MYISADPIGLLGLLLLLLKSRGSSSTSSTPSRPAPGPALPENTAQTEPAPWPQVMPAGLPVFPGSGWEYDEPPPPSVQKRAQALVSSLWARGSGSFKTELVGGRWITFRAEKVRSGKQGVVAYRQRIAKKPKPAETAQAPAGQQPAAIPVSTSATGEQTVHLKKGRTYAYVVKIDTLGKEVAPADLARGLAAAGATKISVEPGRPMLARYQQVVPADVSLVLNKPLRIELVPGYPLLLTIVSVKEVKAEAPKPTPPKPKEPLPPGDLVSTAPVSNPLVLRDLKYGDGLLPAAPVEEVKIVQERLKVKPVDGRFGDGTRNAVIAFQVETGLAPKGVKLEELRARGFGAVKRATWEKLFSVRV